MTKRILTAVLCILLILGSLVSCGDSQAEVGVPVVKKAESGALIDATLREIPEQYYNELRNVYYSAYNIGIPMMYVKLPTKAESYGYSSYDYTALDELLNNEFIDTLDLTALFTESPDSYYYKYAESFNADGARLVCSQITSVLPEWYSILTDTVNNSAEGYYVRSDDVGAAPSELSLENGVFYYNGIEIKPSYIGLSADDTELPSEDYFYYSPADDPGYRVRYYGGNTSRSSFVEGKYGEAVFDTASYNEAAAAGNANAAEHMLYKGAMTATIANENVPSLTNKFRGTDSVSAIIVHDLDDASVIGMLADCFTRVIAIDVRACEKEAVVALIRENPSADVVITMLSYDTDWPLVFKGKSGLLKCSATDPETDHSEVPFKTEGRVMRKAYPASENIDSYIKNMTQLKAKCDELGTELLFVQTPSKNFEGITRFPEGIEDFSNSDADTFLAGIEANGIRTLDLRDTILDYMTPDEAFYRTDHHWRAESGFWAFGQIVEYLRTNLGWTDVDPKGMLRDKANYTFEKREDYFVGSLARDLDGPLAGMDDFTLIYPNFQTRFNLTNDRNGILTVSIGGYYNAILAQNYLTDTKPTTNRYAAYLNGDQPHVMIKNLSSGYDISDKKVLVVKDSFANVVNPFMALAFSELEFIDVRHYKLSTLRQYISQHDFDIVIILYNPNLYYAASNIFRF